MREDTALLEQEETLQTQNPETTDAAPVITETLPEEIVVDGAPIEEVVVEDVSEEMSVAEFLAAETTTSNTREDSNTEEIPSDEPSAEEMSDEHPSEEITAEADAEDSIVPADEEPPAPTPTIRPYHERYYLRYREGKRSTALDLSGTKAFLQDIGFDGGELRQARIGRKSSDNFRNDNLGLGSMIRCSYCGAEIGGVEFFHMPDGRKRCTSCSNSLVTSKAEVEALLQRVITNMGNFFGATFNVPVSIEVMDELRLKKKIGLPLGTQDSQSLLILGVAINKKNKFSIILENGAPRISLIATFAHELTHIWQYTHWDNVKGFQQCPASKRLLIYEGMAKWAEIQYLYLIGETDVAKREEFITRNREDAYGAGFCLYEEWFPLSREVMSPPVTPFTPERYPFN